MENDISKDTLTPSEKLNVTIQNFDFVTHSEYDNLKQQVDTEDKNIRIYFEDKYNQLLANHEDNLSYITSLSISLSKLEKEFNDYKEFVDNVYLKIPQRMGWFRRLLFRIIFGKDK